MLDGRKVRSWILFSVLWLGVIAILGSIVWGLREANRQGQALVKRCEDRGGIWLSEEEVCFRGERILLDDGGAQ